MIACSYTSNFTCICVSFCTSTDLSTGQYLRAFHTPLSIRAFFADPFLGQSSDLIVPPAFFEDLLIHFFGYLHLCFRIIMSLSWGTCPVTQSLPQQPQNADKFASCDKLHQQRQHLIEANTKIGTSQKQPISCSTVIAETYPYEPSIASSASSSVSSVFSDTASQTSSTSSNSQAEGDDLSSERVNPLQPVNEFNPTTFFPGVYHGHHPFVTSKNPAINIQTAAQAPPEQRQHPRRCSLAGGQRPPPLVRQSERKVNFVDNLVGKLTIPVLLVQFPS